MMTHEQAVEVLATYALDAVPSDEREAIEHHLADCPRCRADLDALREVTAALGNSVEPLPEGLWSSIASRLPDRHDEERPPMPRLVRGDAAGEATAGEATTATPRGRARQPLAGRGRMATIIGTIAAAAAVVAVLSVGLVHANDQVSQLQRALGQANPNAVASALLTPGHQVVNLESAQHINKAQFVLADGRGYLVTSDLPALSADDTYQLWGIVDGKPISLGLLGQRPDKSTFTLAGRQSASKLGITIEPSGGSAVPSPPMVALGTV
jgi:anti-sigma-K factor RskA